MNKVFQHQFLFAPRRIFFPTSPPLTPATVRTCALIDRSTFIDHKIRMLKTWLLQKLWGEWLLPLASQEIEAALCWGWIFSFLLDLEFGFHFSKPINLGIWAQQLQPLQDEKRKDLAPCCGWGYRTQIADLSGFLSAFVSAANSTGAQDLWEGTSLMPQWLRLCSPNAGGLDWIPGHN